MNRTLVIIVLIIVALISGLWRVFRRSFNRHQFSKQTAFQFAAKSEHPNIAAYQYRARGANRDHQTERCTSTNA